MISRSKTAFTAWGVFCLFWTGASWASSDNSETWELTPYGIEATPYLAPENDTRVNLILLEAERHQLTLPVTLPTPEQEKEIKPLFTGYEAIHYESLLSEKNAAKEKRATLIQAMIQTATELNLSSEILSMIPEIEAQEGRCVSNDLQAIHQFWQALSHDESLTLEQRQSLAVARLDMTGDWLCPQAEIQNLTLTNQLLNWPEEGNPRAFAHYLLASLAFYAGDFEQAEQGFTQLAKNPQPWIAEASTYMLARVALNQSAIHALDEWGFIDSEKIDSNKIIAAKNRLDSYLQQYPQGTYAHSAEGLYRRVYWMQGNLDKLAEAYQQAFNTAPDLPTLLTLVFEADIRLLENRKFPGAANTPELTLVQALKNLRYPDSIPDSFATSVSLLPDAQSRYVLLMKAFASKEYQQVVNTVASPPTTPLSLLEFSQQILKGQALMALERYDESEQLWRSLLKIEENRLRNRLLQKMLASTLALNGKVDEIFAKQSPVTSLILRKPYLFFISEQQLRTQASESSIHPWERIMALETLLLNDLLLGRYTQFLEDDALSAPLKAESVQLEKQMNELGDWSTLNLAIFDWPGQPASTGYACASLRQTVQSLSKNPNDAHARNCVGEFLRATRADFTWNYRTAKLVLRLDSALLRPFNIDQLPQHRLAGYMQVIKNPKAEIEDKSYALYRAVYCFAPAGYNDCGPEEIPKSLRKQWFQQLKKEYGDTQWGKKIKYYW